MAMRRTIGSSIWRGLLSITSWRSARAHWVSSHLPPEENVSFNRKSKIMWNFPSNFVTTEVIMSTLIISFQHFSNPCLHCSHLYDLVISTLVTVGLGMSLWYAPGSSHLVALRNQLKVNSLCMQIPITHPPGPNVSQNWPQISTLPCVVLPLDSHPSNCD